MAADGTWNLTMQTPMGERRSTLTLSTAGGNLTGTVDGNELNGTADTGMFGSFPFQGTRA